MKVRYEDGREGDLTWVPWEHFTSVRLPDLTCVPDDDLCRCHAHAKRQLWRATGPARAGGGRAVLDPLEAEMRRRGLKAVYWTGGRRPGDVAERTDPLT